MGYMYGGNSYGSLYIRKKTDEQAEAELQIRESLKEKEILLKEVHHRIKNNLQLMSSMLRLQATYAGDKLTGDIFRESHTRIRSIAMIHEQLYSSQILSSIDIGSYLFRLASNIITTYQNKKTITLIDDTEYIYLPVNQAIPCGLITNEVITNILKHAF